MKQENETGSLFKHCVHDEEGETIPRYNGKYPQENGHTCNGNAKVSCYTYLFLLQIQCIEKSIYFSWKETLESADAHQKLNRGGVDQGIFKRGVGVKGGFRGFPTPPPILWECFDH